MTNLTATAAAAPDRPAIKLDETEVPYRSLDAASARVVRDLRARAVVAQRRT